MNRLVRAMFSCLLTACGGAVAAGPAASTQVVEAAASAVEDDALELRLSALAQALGEQGYAQGGLRDRGFLPANGRATRPVRVEPNTCALFVAVATPSVIDLDASLYRADGTALIEDEGSDARPSLKLCAGDTVVTGYYALHAYQGVGAFATAQFVRPAVPGDDDLSIIEREGGPSALAELAKALHKRGFEDAAPRVELKLTGPRAVRMAVPAKQGDCYTLAAEGGPKLEGLSLRLLNGQGHELAHGVADSALASLQYCADESEELSLEVSAREGSGSLRVARFRAAHASLGGAHALWLGEPSPSPQAWQGRVKAVSELRKELAAEGTRAYVLQEKPLGQGSVLELEVPAPLGACESWQIQLQPGLSRARFRVESADGRVLGEARSAGMLAELLVCERRGPARVIVVGEAGFGSITLLGRPRDAAH
jgi:hypothetical protein